MNKTGKWIIILLGLGVTLFVFVQFYMIPKQNAANEKYILQQRRPLTHDFEYIIEYKHPYMGDASNISNLFNHLPLNEVKKDFELDSDHFAIIVNYHQKVTQLDLHIFQQSILYNSIAAFALIGNLEKIEYRFEDKSFVVQKQNVTKRYGDLSQLIKNKEAWNEKVRNPLKDEKYVTESFLFILEK